MQRSLLVQTLLNMATGSGGAKLEALVVDAAGTFDAGKGKGYNPVTVPSGSVNVLGEKGVVSNNSVVVTPKAQIVGGWVNGGETSGAGVGVTASELVSGTLNVSSDGVQDVTNYKDINVPSAGHSASAHKGVVSNHSIIVTPRSTATQGFVQAGTVEGTPVSVAASELVSGTFQANSNGVFDVSNYKFVEVSGVMQKTLIGEASGTESIGAYGKKIINVPVSTGTEYDAILFTCVITKGQNSQLKVDIRDSTTYETLDGFYMKEAVTGPIYGANLYTNVTNYQDRYVVAYYSNQAYASIVPITATTPVYLYSDVASTVTYELKFYGIKY